jgi:hypothetical protein
VRVDGVLTVIENGGWREAEELYNAWKRKQDNLEREAAALRAADELKQQQAEEQRLRKLEAEATGELRLVQLCNMYLDHEQKRVKQKDLTAKSYLDIEDMTDLVLRALDKHKIVSDLSPEDFAKIRDAMVRTKRPPIGEPWSPARIGKFIGLVDTMFNVAYDNEWIENKPRYGAGFKRPSKKRCDEYANEGGDKLFTREEILALLNGGWVKDKKQGRIWVEPKKQMRAMILLGLNCGFGNTDISVVPVGAFDLKGRVVRLPRTKTASRREIPLWPETIEAVKAVLAERPDSELPNLFLTRFGGPWVHGKTDAVQKQFGVLMKAHKIAPDIRNAGFYVLRHCFSTIGMQVGDRDGVKSITGHTDKEMIARYNHGLPPMKRRVDVINHVRQWLFGRAKNPKKSR